MVTPEVHFSCPENVNNKIQRGRNQLATLGPLHADQPARRQINQSLFLRVGRPVIDGCWPANQEIIQVCDSGWPRRRGCFIDRILNSEGKQAR